MQNHPNLLTSESAGLTRGFQRQLTAGPTGNAATGRPDDLVVDTALLRQAAELMDDATGALRGGGTCEVLRCPLSDASLGSSAAGREVVAASDRRVAEAVEGAAMLALRAATLAEKLRATAVHFELAEASAIPGPR